MNKRLRKKRRVGEFEELGFAVVGELRAGLSEVETDAFVERLISALEARHLGVGGGCGAEGRFEGFVTRAGRGSATDDDRGAVSRLLARDSAVVGYEVGALCDAWAHGRGTRRPARATGRRRA